MQIILDWPDQVVMGKKGNMLWTRLRRAHRVISTVDSCGGIREDITGFYNHQSCESDGHSAQAIDNLIARNDELHRQRCHDVGLDPAQTIAMGTAANMNCYGYAERRWKGLAIAAICTAGVQGNAGCATDKASVIETEQGYLPLGSADEHRIGTIVTTVIANQEFSPAGLTRACVMATEAKVAIMRDLLIGSRYSTRLATGTGTDQLTIAAPIGAGHPITSPGKHTLAGQLLAEAVYAAIEEALILQNDYSRPARRKVSAQLSRFGYTCEKAVEMAASFLDEPTHHLFATNIVSIDSDPETVAAVSGLVAVVDQIHASILPSSCLGTSVRWAGALIASAASCSQLSVQQAADELSYRLPSMEADDLCRWVVRCLTLGYREKWAFLTRERDRSDG